MPFTVPDLLLPAASYLLEIGLLNAVEFTVDNADSGRNKFMAFALGLFLFQLFFSFGRKYDLLLSRASLFSFSFFPGGKCFFTFLFRASGG